MKNRKRFRTFSLKIVVAHLTIAQNHIILRMIKKKRGHHMKSCINCQRELPVDDMVFCPYCGEKQQNPVVKSGSTKKTHRKFLIIAICVVTVIAAIALTLTVLNINKKKVRGHFLVTSVYFDGVDLSGFFKGYLDFSKGDTFHLWMMDLDGQVMYDGTGQFTAVPSSNDTLYITLYAQNRLDNFQYFDKSTVFNVTYSIQSQTIRMNLASAIWEFIKTAN